MKFRTHNKKKGAAVLIITALLALGLLLTGCPTPNTPTPPTKYAITFSVDSTTPNGTLKAKAEGLPETEASPINVEQGKTITFTATANDGYRVKGWTLDGKPFTEAGTNTEYKLKVTQAATVKVSFEEIPKHAITFSVDSTTPNGTLKAKADGVDETSTSPINVEEGKTVTFTAEPSTNYKVKEWKVGDTVVTGNKTNTYTHTVTQATTVSVSFELSPVEGGAVLILSPDKLTIEVEAKTVDGSAIAVEGCNEITLEKGKSTKLHAKGTKVILKGNITELYCFDNKLTELNVQGLTSLQVLNCRNNQLTALNVQGCTALQGLDCVGNKLTELNVQGLTALQGLSCEGNKLTELNVQGLTALQELWCSGNQLPELNVQGLTALQVLGCGGNKLTSLNVSGLTSLQKVWCDNNKLTSLNIQGCTALKYLRCNGNKLNAQAMTKLLNTLPQRKESDDAEALLYTGKTGEVENNCKDYNTPADLKKAFDGAKSRNWKLRKENANGMFEDI